MLYSNNGGMRMIILVKEGNSYNTVIKEYEAVTNSDKANFDVSNK